MTAIQEATMIVASAFSRRELLKRFGMASAAAIALPELSRVLLFQREVLAREQARQRARFRR